ncbi:MAG: glycosyltransferase family 4 protein [Prevotellaceae bacterium]|jgi:glycosyltransferase involved in cell wall biosynthesis|nr:glycosyltransferase family 4 protein [Prevotellaceae bacterium]
MNIFFATSARGFMKPLFLRTDLAAKLVFSNSQLYSSTSKLKSVLSKIVRNRIFDVLGVIQVIRPPKGYDLYGSCNRFLDTDSPYFIHVENPTALFHYCLGRNKSFLGKRKVKKNLNNSHLSALIFWSDACRDTFESVCGKIPETVIRKTIYALIPSNNNISRSVIKTKSRRKELKLLYCVQGLRFLSKGGLEVVEAYQKLRNAGYDNILLTIITNLDVIGRDLCKKITDLGITLLDFKFSPEQMEKIYADTNILLQPTSDESFGMTILEAMKAGCTVLASRLYAIPEMVEEGENGFLTDPAWWFFNPDSTPNPKVWNHRKKTIYSGKISDRIVSFLIEKIQLLNNNRDLLERMSISSYEKANSAPFDEETIVSQWNEVFREMAKIR